MDAMQRMEANISAVLRHDTECISAVHCLKVPPLTQTLRVWRCRFLWVCLSCNM